MTSTNFPGGFANGVTIRGIPVVMTHPGNVFWVDSGAGSNQNRGTDARPFATIDYAIGRCTASNGDIIFVKPGHTETISAASGIDLDVAGVAVIGLGKGSLRPTITLDTATTATFVIDAADVTVHNLLFKANFADIAAMIVVTGTDAHIDSCEFVAQAANMNWLDVISASGADDSADGLMVTGCKAYGLDTANNSFMLIANDINRMWVEGNTVVHDNANALAFITHTTGGIILNGMVKDNNYSSLLTAVDALVNNDVATNSGFVIGNNVSHADVAADVLVDADGMGMFDNLGTGVITEAGTLEDFPQSGIRTVHKINGLVTSAAADPLFTVSGGPIHILSIVGVVSTQIQSQANALKLQAAITTPSGDTDMSTAVETNGDVVGTIYNFQGPTGILTPVTAGIDLIDVGHSTLAPTQWIMTPGDIEAIGAATSTGGVDWSMSYVPLSPLSKVIAAP